MTPEDLTLRLLASHFGNEGDKMSEPTAQLLLQALEFAAEHDVSPLLASGLRNLPASQSAWRKLLPLVEPLEAQTLARAEIYRTAAAKLIRKLDAIGVTAVMLKGAAFCLDPWTRATPRIMSDLDVLIAPADLPRAVEALRNAGMTTAEDLAGFAEGLHHHFPALYDEEHDVFVELHVRLTQNAEQSPISPQQVFADVDVVHWQGQTFLLPSPGHRLMHLVVHDQVSNLGYALRRINLRAAADAMALQKGGRVDWSGIRNAFRAIGEERLFMTFVLSLNRLMALPLPFPASDFRSSEKWVTHAITALGDPPATWLTAVRLARHYAAQFAAHPSRLRLLARTLVSPARRQDLFRINRSRLRRRKPAAAP